MFDFHRTSAPQNYLSGRVQRRLLLWVMLIGLPMIAVARLVDYQTKPPEAGGAAAVEAIDTRLPDPAARDDVPGTFTSPAIAERERSDAIGRYFPGVHSDYLSSVRDDTPSRTADRDAFFNLFDLLSRTPDQRLHAASLGPTTYVQMFQQPEVYRGKLVDVSGTVRRAHRLPLDINELGLSDNYQLYLSPKDAATNPIIVYCLNLPQGFPTGMDVKEPVEITGFFLKRVAYAAKGGYMTAPMLLAKNVRWMKTAPPVQGAVARGGSASGWIMAVAASLCVLGLAIALVLASRWAGQSAVRRPAIKPETLAALIDAPQVQIEEELQRLSRKER